MTDKQMTAGPLYERLHSLSKSLESSGRIDEGSTPEAYATIIDAMNFVAASSAYAAQEVAKEREACAKGCDDALDGFTESSEWATGYVTAVKDIADGIRSRKS